MLIFFLFLTLIKFSFLPPLNSAIAFKHAYSEWSTRNIAKRASNSRSRRNSSMRICFRSAGKIIETRIDSSTEKFHCAAVRTNNSLQDSSSKIAWSRNDNWE